MDEKKKCVRFIITCDDYLKKSLRTLRKTPITHTKSWHSFD